MARHSPFGTHWHPRLIEAAMALNENRLDVAERMLKPHLKEDPFDARGDPHAGRARGADRAAGAMPRTCFGERSSWRRAGPRPRPTSRWCSGGWAGRPRRCELLDDIFAAEPDEIGHWNLKAATLGRLGDFDEAIALYEDVLRRGAGAAAGVAELRPHAQDGRAAGRGHRRLSQGDRHRADAWAKPGGASPT